MSVGSTAQLVKQQQQIVNHVLIQFKPTYLGVHVRDLIHQY